MQRSFNDTNQWCTFKIDFKCFWITSFTPHSEQHCRDSVGFKLCSSKHLVQVLAAGAGERNGGFGCDEAQRTNHTSRRHHKSSDFHKHEKFTFTWEEDFGPLSNRPGRQTLCSTSGLILRVTVAAPSRRLSADSQQRPLKSKWNILTLSYWSSDSYEQ